VPGATFVFPSAQTGDITKWLTEWSLPNLSLFPLVGLALPEKKNNDNGIAPL